MKRITSLQYAIMAIFMLAISTTASAQVLNLDKKSLKMSISGTTNVHDFECKVTDATGKIVYKGDNNFSELVVNVPVESIKGKEKMMDKKTYETFNSKKHPNITFNMTKVSSLKVNGDNIDIEVSGNLTMAGETRPVTLKAKGLNSSDGNYIFTGSLPIKMSTFNMKAPTAMLGVMKVGDEITLSYEATFTGEQLSLK